MISPNYSEIQSCVPKFYSKKTRKLNFLTVIFVILLCIALVFVLIFAALGSKYRDFFKPKTFFLVYADSSSDFSFLSSLCEGVKLQGGAGCIFKHNGRFFLIYRVYFDRESAQAELKNIERYYDKSRILELPTKRFSALQQRRLLENSGIKKYFLKFENFSEIVINITSKLIGGECDKFEILKFLTTAKFELNELIGEQAGGKIDIKIKQHEAFVVSCIDNFLSNYPNSTKIISLASELAANIACAEFALMDNL